MLRYWIKRKISGIPYARSVFDTLRGTLRQFLPEERTKNIMIKAMKEKNWLLAERVILENPGVFSSYQIWRRTHIASCAQLQRTEVGKNIGEIDSAQVRVNHYFQCNKYCVKRISEVKGGKTSFRNFELTLVAEDSSTRLVGFEKIYPGTLRNLVQKEIDLHNAIACHRILSPKLYGGLVTESYCSVFYEFVEGVHSPSRFDRMQIVKDLWQVTPPVFLMDKYYHRNNLSVLDEDFISIMFSVKNVDSISRQIDNIMRRSPIFVMHSDLNPFNLFLLKDGNMKLIDWFLWNILPVGLGGNLYADQLNAFLEGVGTTGSVSLRNIIRFPEFIFNLSIGSAFYHYKRGDFEATKAWSGIVLSEYQSNQGAL